MNADGFTSAVDAFRVKLDLLKEAWLELRDCELMEAGEPFIDDAWDEYLTARIDAEVALTDFVQEVAGFYVLAQIKNVHVGGVE